MIKYKMYKLLISLFFLLLLEKDDVNILGNNDNIIIHSPTILKYIPYEFELNFKDTNNLIIKSDCAIISKKQNGKYQFNAFESGFLKIYRIQSKKEIKIDSTFLKVINAPFTIYFNNKTSGDFISYNELRNGRFRVTILNQDINLNFPIRKVNGRFFVNDGLNTFINNGNRISNNSMLRYSRKLNEYQPIIFDVTIKIPNDSSLTLEPIVYYYK